MPELPEVETVRRGLDPVLAGKRITKATVNRPDLRWPFPDRMAERLTGATVVSLGRRSKYILANLSTGETLIVHLGMSGRMLISGVDLGGRYHNHEPAQKHDHVVIDVEGGARVTFNDPRRFGFMDLWQSATLDNHPMIAKLGPEPLGNNFNETYLADRLRGKRTPIKTALLDQRIVAGLGNIYVCEALFRAGISPTSHAGKISRPRINRLVPIVREVLREAIEAGGSSLRDFRRADGELGYFQHAFNVYDQEGQPCPRPDCTGKVRRVVQAGRSTFYCAKCQR